MQRSLREVLVDSHIAAVTIALLLVWSLYAAFDAIFEPLARVLIFFVTAVAIRDIPSYSKGLEFQDRVMLIKTALDLYTAIVAFLSAWLVSRWIYNQGPVRSLARYYKAVTWRNRV